VHRVEFTEPELLALCLLVCYAAQVQLSCYSHA